MDKHMRQNGSISERRTPAAEREAEREAERAMHE
jgi:hypothetical protein